jgi:hypothetical protein
LLEIEKILVTTEVSKLLHKHTSPTTDCANEITKLNMNCAVSKPLKLNRGGLLQNSTTKPKTTRERNASATTNQESPKVSDICIKCKNQLLVDSFSLPSLSSPDISGQVLVHLEEQLQKTTHSSIEEIVYLKLMDNTLPFGKS